MAKLKGVKTIIFDIDNMLFPSSEFAAIARKNAINAMIEAGLNVKFDEAYAELMKIVRKYGSNYPHHFDKLCGHFGMKENKIIAAGIYGYHDTKLTLQPYPDVPRTLLTLKLKGYRLFVASEGLVLKQWEKLIRLKLHHFFSAVFVSEEVGVEKSKEFFQRIKNRLGNAETCLMAGDKLDKDIIPAKEAGMKTALVLKDSVKSSLSNSKALNTRALKYIDVKLSSFSELLRFL